MKLGYTLILGLILAVAITLLLTISEIIGNELGIGAAMVIIIASISIAGKLADKYLLRTANMHFPKATWQRLLIISLSTLAWAAVCWQTVDRNLDSWLILLELALFFIWVNYWEVRWRDKDRLEQ